MSTSLPELPNRFAAGSAPLTSLIVITSLPPSPKTWIFEVLATVGVPLTATAPPLTRIWPAALRLTVMLLSRLSPLTVSWPPVKVAVTAACAEAVVAARMPAASALPAIRRRAAWLRPCVMCFSVGAWGRKTTDARSPRLHSGWFNLHLRLKRR